MKTKKCGAYAALAAVLLITAVLVLTCVDPITPGGLTNPKDGEKEVFTPPPGKAYIIVRLPSVGGRTILPTLPAAITKYSVNINGTGGTTGSYDEDDADAYANFTNGNKEVFTVPAGTYTVTVSGSSAGDVLLAIGQGTVTVNAAGAGDVTITMKGIVDSTTTGDFVYNLTLPTGVDAFGAATISAQLYPSGAALTFTQPDLLFNATSNAGTISNVASGYYWLRVTMTKDRHASVVHEEILHIYGNQTTTWATALPALVKNTYDVTYKIGYTGTGAPADVEDDNDGDGWPNGGTVTINTAYTTPPTRTGYIFDDWYHLSPITNTTIPWVFDDGATPTKIYRDTTLTAQWHSADGLEVTLIPYAPTEGAFHFNPTSAVSYTLADVTAITGFNVINITGLLTNGVAAPNTVTYFDSATWRYNGEQISPDNILTSARITAYNTTNSAYPEKQITFTEIKDYVFTFVGVIGGASYNYNFTISIVPYTGP